MVQAAHSDLVSIARQCTKIGIESPKGVKALTVRDHFPEILEWPLPETPWETQDTCSAKLKKFPIQAASKTHFIRLMSGMRNCADKLP